MTHDQVQTFGARVQDVFASLGGKATIDDVTQAVANSLDVTEYRSLTWPGFKTLVRNALRAQDSDGLVRAAAINGTYVQRTLWDESEYRFVIRMHMKKSRAEHSLAYVYAEECMARLGVWIDPAEVANA